MVFVKIRIVSSLILMGLAWDVIKVTNLGYEENVRYSKEIQIVRNFCTISAERAQIDTTLTKIGNASLCLPSVKIIIKTAVYAQAATLDIDSQRNLKASASLETQFSILAKRKIRKLAIALNVQMLMNWPKLIPIKSFVRKLTLIFRIHVLNSKTKNAPDVSLPGSLKMDSANKSTKSV